VNRLVDAVERGARRIDHQSEHQRGQHDKDVGDQADNAFGLGDAMALGKTLVKRAAAERGNQQRRAHACSNHRFEHEKNPAADGKPSSATGGTLARGLFADRVGADPYRRLEGGVGALHRSVANVVKNCCRACKAAASLPAASLKSIPNQIGQMTRPATPAPTFWATLSPCSFASWVVF
jgi:hypothetical protein